MDGDRLMFSGRSFHNIGAAAVKYFCQNSPIDIAEMSVGGFPCIAECAFRSTQRAVHVGMQVRVHLIFEMLALKNTNV